MTHAPKMPLSAVGMIAAHLFIERVKAGDMSEVDLRMKEYGTNGGTYAQTYARDAAVRAWQIAAAVEAAAPVEP